MKTTATRSRSEIDTVNDALHALLRGLHLTRLGHWSANLENINFLDLHVLSYAENHPDHTLREMRAAIEVPQSTMTSMIDRLEQRGLVRRAINPRDKRSYLIELTPAGREVQREHHRVDRLIATRMLGSLPDEKSRRQFARLLVTMTEAMRSEA